MIVLLLLLLFILCYVYIRYTELKNKDLTVDGTVCDVIGELIALMIFADNKREFKEYEVATTAINHRFKISVSDKVKTSILEYYNQQMVVELDSDRIDRTKAEIATVSEPLGKLSASDRLAIMEVLCCVAKVSGFKKSEWELFKLIGAQLNIADNEMNRYRLFFEPHLLNTASAEDYAVLGLTPDASQQDVQESYTMLLHKYLTDGVTDESLKIVLAAKRQEVEDAYGRIMG